MTFGRLMKTLRRWDETQQMRIICVDMAGDFVAGYILGRLIYWHDDDRNGHSRLRVERNGHFWVARTHRAWFEECRLTEKQARLAIAKLSRAGLIESRTFKFDGNPTVHLRIVEDEFMKKWNFHVDNAPPVESFRPRSDEGKAALSSHLVMDKKAKTKTPKKPIRSGQTSRSKSPKQAISSTSDTTLVTQQQQQTPAKNSETETSDVVVVDSQSLEKPALDENAQLVSDLKRLGVGGAVAEQIANENPEECRRQLEFFPFHETVKNTGAFLSQAIRKSYGPPEGFVAQENARSAQEKARAAQEARAAQDAQEQARIAQETAKLEAEAAQLDQIWETLPEKLKTTLQNRAIEQLGVLGRSGRAQAALLAMRRNLLRDLLAQAQGDAAGEAETKAPSHAVPLPRTGNRTGTGG